MTGPGLHSETTAPPSPVGLPRGGGTGPPAGADRAVIRSRVAVQCRDRLLGDTLVEWCGRQRPLVAVGPAADATGLVRLCRTHPPDLVVFEVDDASCDPLWVLDQIAGSAPPALRPFVIGLHHGAGSGLIARLRAAGAVDRLVDCSAGLASFGAAIRDFLALPRAVGDPSRYHLTPRELEVLALLAASCGVAEIAAVLGVTRRTVENHKRHIFVKLDVHCSSHAVAAAASAGLLTQAAPAPRAAGRRATVTLTGRERDVLELADRGYSTKQTARMLDLSARTVENIWRHLFGKLGVHDRAGVLAVVHDWGELPVGPHGGGAGRDPEGGGGDSDPEGGGADSDPEGGGDGGRPGSGPCSDGSSERT